MNELTSALAAALPDGRVLTDPDVVDSYARDRTFVTPGRPLGVVLAQSRDDVVATMRWASEHRVPVLAATTLAKRPVCSATSRSPISPPQS
ncbi:FAD-binding oxidoreductase, partial [Microbispora rosea]